MLLQGLTRVRDWLDRLWCRWGWGCTLGEPYEFPREHEPYSFVLLARCVYYGSIHRLT